MVEEGSYDLAMIKALKQIEVVDSDPQSNCGHEEIGPINQDGHPLAVEVSFHFSLLSEKESEGTKNKFLGMQNLFRGCAEGSSVAGKYRIIERLGEGGMGVVYKAEDTRLDRKVALKLLPQELMQDPDTKQRFIREAKAAAALSHPNICTIHEMDEEEDKSYKKLLTN